MKVDNKWDLISIDSYINRLDGDSMRQKDIYYQPGYLIRRLHQRSTAEFAAATAGQDVTQIQFSILLAVRDIPGIDATRISELIFSDRTTVRQALLVLEKRNLVRRESGARDRRTKTLGITNEGRSLVESVADVVPKLGDEILRGLTKRESKIFTRLLMKMVEQDGRHGQKK